MNLFNSLNLARIDASIPQLIALLIPISVLITGAVIVVSLIYAHNRRRQMWHETARLALEKGQPLPPLIEEQTQSARSRSRVEASDDIRSGLISIAVGAALYVFLSNFLGRGLGYVGAIPGFVGVALLLFGLVRLMVQRRAGERNSRPGET